MWISLEIRIFKLNLWILKLQTYMKSPDLSLNPHAVKRQSRLDDTLHAHIDIGGERFWGERHDFHEKKPYHRVWPRH